MYHLPGNHCCSGTAVNSDGNMLNPPESFRAMHTAKSSSRKDEEYEEAHTVLNPHFHLNLNKLVQRKQVKKTFQDLMDLDDGIRSSLYRTLSDLSCCIQNTYGSKYHLRDDCKSCLVFLSDTLLLNISIKLARQTRNPLISVDHL